MNFFKILFLSLALICVSFGVSANCSDSSSHSHRKSKTFKLKEFAGSYVVEFKSIGGVSGQSGASSSVLAHIKFNKKGEGKFDYLQGVIYTGPIGSSLITFTTLKTLKAKLTLSNPGFGRGKITFTTPDAKTTIEFLATKLKGKVNQLIGHVITSDPRITGAETCTLIRQFN